MYSTTFFLVFAQARSGVVLVQTVLVQGTYFPVLSTTKTRISGLDWAFKGLL